MKTKIAIITLIIMCFRLTAQNKIDSIGNIGIGTITPNEKLEIKEGDIRIYGLNTSRYIRFVEGKLQGAFINYDGTKNILNLGVHHSSTTDSNDDYNSLSILRSNGNVGIGTTTPSQKLDVNGRIIVSKPYDAIGFETNGLILRNSTMMDNTSVNGISLATSKAINYGYSINTIRTLNGQGNFNIKYHNNSISGKSRFFIDQNGKVGIGTTSTGNHKLAVEGSIGAREIKVEAYPNWSDFVFEKSYNLPTLKEVEEHIKEKGHLKDIPNAEEIKKNGFFLGEMDAKLLQKIEELTLYTIEQEKKLKIQEKKIDALEKKNSEIEELKSLVHKLLKDKN